MAYRIDDRTAVSLLPAPRTTGLGTPGFFTAGDPQTGEGATVVTDTWLNMVQEELVGVVLGAGLSLDKTDNAQLVCAIRSLISVSLAANAVQTFADDADFQINHIGVNKQTGDIWGWNATSGVFFHMATVAALQAESLRAQTAEAALQPAGNYVTGNGFSSGDAGVTNIWRDSQGGLSVNVRDGTVIQLPRRGDVTHLLENSVQTFADDADFQINHIGVNKQTGDIWGWNATSGVFFHMATVAALQAESLRAQTAEAGLQPAGNYLVATGTRQRKTQSFTVRANQGFFVNFPEPFADDDVQLSLCPADGGNNRIHFANWFSVNRTGFQLSLNVWTGSSIAEETSLTAIMVIAEGNL